MRTAYSMTASLLGAILCLSVVLLGCVKSSNAASILSPSHSSSTNLSSPIDASCVTMSREALHLSNDREYGLWCGPADCLAYNASNVIGELILNQTHAMMIRSTANQKKLATCISEEFFSSRNSTQFFVGDERQYAPLLEHALLGYLQTAKIGGLWHSVINGVNRYRKIVSLCCNMSSSESLLPAWELLSLALSPSQLSAWSEFIQPSVIALQKDPTFALSHPMMQGRDAEWMDRYRW